MIGLIILCVIAGVLFSQLIALKRGGSSKGSVSKDMLTPVATTRGPDNEMRKLTDLIMQMCDDSYVDDVRLICQDLNDRFHMASEAAKVLRVLNHESISITYSDSLRKATDRVTFILKEALELNEIVSSFRGPSFSGRLNEFKERISLDREVAREVEFDLSQFDKELKKRKV